MTRVAVMAFWLEKEKRRSVDMMERRSSINRMTNTKDFPKGDDPRKLGN